MVKRYWWTEDGMDDFERGEYVSYDDYAALAERCERLEAEVSGLRAARIAYASEFPLNTDGEPDVGNIHANIRAMKLDAMRYGWAVQSPQFLMWMNANTKKQADTYIDSAIASIHERNGGKA